MNPVKRDHTHRCTQSSPNRHVEGLVPEHSRQPNPVFPADSAPFGKLKAQAQPTSLRKPMTSKIGKNLIQVVKLFPALCHPQDPVPVARITKTRIEPKAVYHDH